MSELIASVVEVVADRRTNPRPDDFPTVVSQMEIDGEKLTDEEILGVCSTIVGAGIDTTTALLAQAFVHLDQNRDDRQRLIEQPELLTSTTEEFLR